MKQVKREMGADAVVLHTRTFRRGGIMGFGARTLVEITAADGREVAAEKRKHRDRAERERKQKQLANQHRRNAKVERMKASVGCLNRICRPLRCWVTTRSARVLKLNRWGWCS